MVSTPGGSDGSGDNRHALRKPVRLKAQLRDRGTTRFEIDILDLSTTGFRAETSFTLWPDHIVWLTLPGLSSLEATVAWRDGLHYGCAFTNPLHPAVFDHLVRLSEEQGSGPVPQ
ncbi:pilus assembly protein PilZ [Hephaestia sp. GCM10023244]|uniref:pilus assembly protein PilZ n=1 Tax=unclassified Hephaestia TaxID=2631281 RepID=UPI002076EA87|nr:pilus assembly protein PilZ [Hephaestia sp. MAHUQ-44]MCM8731200.1 pilus assembly protein PilZ [Hephaestia sp. MAHUQ-44]